MVAEADAVPLPPAPALAPPLPIPPVPPVAVASDLIVPVLLEFVPVVLDVAVPPAVPLPVAAV